MTMNQLLHILLRRWHWLLACVGIGLAIGGVLALTLPSVYMAQAQVVVDVDKASGVSAVEQSAYVTGLVPTVLEVARSGEFADAVIGMPGVDRSATEVAQELNFTLVPDTMVIEVSARDSDSAQARTIASAAVDVLTGPFLERQLNSASGLSFSVLENTGDATTTVFPELLDFVAFGGLAGLLIGIIVVPIRHVLDSSTVDPREMSGTLDAPLLAVVGTRAGRRLGRAIAELGAATTIPGLVGRLGLLRPRQSVVTMTVGGIGGNGGDIMVDLLRALTTGGLRTICVMVDPEEPAAQRIRRLEAASPVEVVEMRSGSLPGLLSASVVQEMLGAPLTDVDLVVLCTSDLTGSPNARTCLDLSDLAVLVCPTRPRRSDLAGVRELVRAGAAPLVGFVIGDDVGNDDVRGMRSTDDGASAGTDGAELVATDEELRMHPVESERPLDPVRPADIVAIRECNPEPPTVEVAQVAFGAVSRSSAIATPLWLPSRFDSHLPVVQIKKQWPLPGESQSRFRPRGEARRRQRGK